MLRYDNRMKEMAETIHFIVSFYQLLDIVKTFIIHFKFKPQHLTFWSL